MNLIKNIIELTYENLKLNNYTLLNFTETPLNKLEQIMLSGTTTSKIVIFSMDHWGDDEDLFVPQHLRSVTQFDNFRKVAQQFPDKKFLVCSTILNLAQALEDISNYQVLHWGEETIIRPNSYYVGTAPQVDKNFKSSKHWIGLNHNPRLYRSILGIYLLGLNLDKTGVLKLNPANAVLDESSWTSFTDFCKNNNRNEIFQFHEKSQIMTNGFERLKNHQGFSLAGTTSSPYIYNNPTNFDTYLRSLYTESFVEIVSDTIFMNNLGLITEKFINSVYGFNFPIILNVSGAVAHLRSIGFDMYDDVIDHSYDSINEPFLRLIAAVDKNKKILSDTDFAKQKWSECQLRMHNNYCVAEQLYSRTVNQTVKFLNNI